MTDLQKPRPLSRRIPWQLVVVFILLTAGLLALSRIFYVLQVRHARAFKESELATVAAMKAGQIADWRSEQLAFAGAIIENRGNAEAAVILSGDPAAEPARSGLLAGLRGLQKGLLFDRAALVLPGGKILLTYPENAVFGSTEESLRLGHAAWRERVPVLGTVDIDASTGRRTVDLMLPLLAADGALPPQALLRISFDAAATLDPILEDWSGHGETGEALLLQRQGDEIVHLSRPRLHPSPALPGPLSVAALRRPGAEATLGEEGLVEGKDYRGRDALMFIKPVADSPWSVGAKFDAAELTSGMTGVFWTMAGITGGLVLVCGLLLCLFWRRSLAAQEAAERSKWDQANRNMDEFMRQMINVMPNPAFFKDTAGRYQGTNAAFEKLLGLSKKEIVGKTLADVAPQEILEKHDDHDQALLTKPGHQVYEAPLKAWDGEHHVIFIKSTYSRPDGTIGGIVGILKDITQTAARRGGARPAAPVHRQRHPDHDRGHGPDRLRRQVQLRQSGRGGHARLHPGGDGRP